MKTDSAVPGRHELYHELVSGASGLALALFMFGHMLLVGSILTGTRGFDWVATMLEKYYIAQPTVIVIFVLFLVHAGFAARKIPTGLRERRRTLRLAKDLAASGRGWPNVHGDRPAFAPHVESLLWIWQVRTGLVILVLGSFHIVLVGLDVLTPVFGEGPGIEAATSLERERAGLWLPYAILTVCVAFHTAVGLYRLAVKWGVGSRLSRRVLRRTEQVILWTMLGFGTVTLAVMAGILPPPLAGLLGS